MLGIVYYYYRVNSAIARVLQGLLSDTVILFVNLLRAAFLPATLHYEDFEDEEDKRERESYGMWPNEKPVSANVLSECVRTIR